MQSLGRRSFGNGGLCRTKLHLVEDILLQHRSMCNPVDAVLREEAAEYHCQLREDGRDEDALAAEHCPESLTDKSMRINHHAEIVGELAEVRGEFDERSVHSGRADRRHGDTEISHLVPKGCAEALEICLCRRIS